MNKLNNEIQQLFTSGVKKIQQSANSLSLDLISINLKTNILCNSSMCMPKLQDFSESFNKLLNKSNEYNNEIDTFITDDELIFNNIKEIIENKEWTTNIPINEFNKVTINTSIAKCTKDEKFYIMRCYEYFYYIYNKKKKQCLMVINNDKKAITMVNILLLTPYLLYGDLYAVHGGLVSDGENNILISNSSLGGKTTFALLFLTNGWNIVTEETTYITKKGEILNFNIRNYFNIRVGTYLEFKDYFINSSIINETFLSMSDMPKEDLFNYGKKDQMSIDFDKLCNDEFRVKNNKITHSLKVSISKENNGINILKCSPTENVDRFLELSLAPTVMLFKELVNYNHVSIKERKQELTTIFQNINSYIIDSDFNYKQNYDIILEKINIKNHNK